MDLHVIDYDWILTSVSASFEETYVYIAIASYCQDSGCDGCYNKHMT